MTDMRSTEEAKLRVMRRLAVVLGTVVVFIFAVTTVLGIVYFSTEHPAKEWFLRSVDEAPRR